MNAKNEILRLLGGEKIIAISLGKHPDDDHVKEAKNPYGYFENDNIVLALEALDFEFDDSFGGENGYPVLVWTETKIIVKGCYDGSEWYVMLPRNPDRHYVPTSIGGG